MKKRILRIIGAVLGSLILIVVVFLCGCTIYHKQKKCNERAELESYTKQEYITVNQKKLNVTLLGDEQCDRKFVFLSGLAINDSSVALEPLADALQNQAELLVIDRPGYGLSEDTNEERTVETIVEEYRLALKQLSITEPVFLIAHSISGMYATYWSRLYPDEIAGIVYLDADAPENYEEQGELDGSQRTLYTLEHVLSQTGIQRLFIRQSSLLGENLNHCYNDEQMRLRSDLAYQNPLSKAELNEWKTCKDNGQTVVSVMNQYEDDDQIPKLYICADAFSGTYYEQCKANQLCSRFKGDSDKINSYLEERNQIREQRLDQYRAYSNISFMTISGPHCLYEYAPAQVADQILGFLSDNQM